MIVFLGWIFICVVIFQVNKGVEQVIGRLQVTILRVLLASFKSGHIARQVLAWSPAMFFRLVIILIDGFEVDNSPSPGLSVRCIKRVSHGLADFKVVPLILGHVLGNVTCLYLNVLGVLICVCCWDTFGWHM